MSMKAIVSATVAATLALGSVSSFAQAYDKHGKVIIIQQQDNRHDNRRNDWRNDRQDDRRNDRREDRRDDRYSQRHDDRRSPSSHQRGEPQRNYYYNARGPEFVRGHVIPRDLRTQQYVVVNYRQHRLAPPPRGQQWVQVGADYVLVAVATGIIASIILNR